MEIGSELNRRQRMAVTIASYLINDLALRYSLLKDEEAEHLFDIIVLGLADQDEDYLRSILVHTAGWNNPPQPVDNTEEDDWSFSF